LGKRGSDEDARSYGGDRAYCVRGEFPDQTKGRGCEGISRLRDGNGQGNHSRYAVFREFDLRNERRQGRRIADADAEQDDPE
jgi:hypothetical protein